MPTRRVKIVYRFLGVVTTIICVCISYAFIQSLREWRSIENIVDTMARRGRMMPSEEFAQEYILVHEKKTKMEGIVSLLHYVSSSRKIIQKKKNILIAVVTTEKYLQTRAVAINQTWAKEIQGNNQLYFFVGENCKTDDYRLQGMPIIKMKGIKDHIYPPQKKVFAVLKYINNFYGEEYRWLIRADDDVYIRISTLHEVLGELDWTDRLLLGRPGWGKAEDRKRLKLLPHENYCMGGPGIVFSAAALKEITPFLDKCLEGVKLYNKQHSHAEGWYNEDVELGRCVSRTLGLGCTNLPLGHDSWADDSYFIHLFDSWTLNMDTLWTRLVLLNAISIHPLKDPDIMFKVHHFIKLREYQSLSTQIDHAATELKQLCSKLPQQIVTKESHNRKKKIMKCFNL